MDYLGFFTNSTSLLASLIFIACWYMHPSQGALSLSLRIGAVLAGLFVAAGAVWMASRYRLSAGAVSFPASSPI